MDRINFVEDSKLTSSERFSIIYMEVTSKGKGLQQITCIEHDIDIKIAGMKNYFQHSDRCGIRKQSGGKATVNCFDLRSLHSHRTD